MIDEALWSLGKCGRRWVREIDPGGDQMFGHIEGASGRGAGLSYSARMTDEAARILELAMGLPESERAAIVVVLLDSIGDGSPPEEIEAA